MLVHIRVPKTESHWLRFGILRGCGKSLFHLSLLSSVGLGDRLDNETEDGRSDSGRNMLHEFRAVRRLRGVDLGHPLLIGS